MGYTSKLLRGGKTLKKQVYEIDSEGFLIEIHIADPSETEHITIDPPNGLYRAKWTGAKWIEDMPQVDIDALNSMPRPPTAEERIAELEQENLMNMLALMELHMLILGGGSE